MSEVQDYNELASSLVAEQHAALTDREMPVDVVEAYADVLEGVAAINGAASQLASDMAELDANKVMLPPAGYQHKRAQIREGAIEQRAAGSRQATEAIGRLRSALIDASQPQLDPRREQLARDEFVAAIGSASGPTLAQRLSRLAASGSAEAVAVALTTPYGRTILEARGLRGRDADLAIDQAKSVVVQKAAEYGSKVALAVSNVGQCEAAVTAAAMGFDLKARRGR